MWLWSDTRTHTWQLGASLVVPFRSMNAAGIHAIMGRTEKKDSKDSSITFGVAHQGIEPMSPGIEYIARWPRKHAWLSGHNGAHKQTLNMWKEIGWKVCTNMKIEYRSRAKCPEWDRTQHRTHSLRDRTNWLVSPTKRTRETKRTCMNERMYISSLVPNCRALSVCITFAICKLKTECPTMSTTVVFCRVMAM